MVIGNTIINTTVRLSAVLFKLKALPQTENNLGETKKWIKYML